MDVNRYFIKFIPAMLETCGTQVGIRILTPDVPDIIDADPEGKYNVSVSEVGVVDLDVDDRSMRLPFNAVLERESLSPGLLAWLDQGFQPVQG